MWESILAKLKSFVEKVNPQTIKTNLGTIIVLLILAGIIVTFSIPKVLNSSTSNSLQLAREDAMRGMAPQEAMMEKVAGASVSMPASAPATAEALATDSQSQPVNMLMASNATILYKPQIIKTANLTIRVENILKSMKLLEATTLKSGGLITDQNVTVSGPNDSFRSGTLTIRVPQERLDNFLNDMAALGTILNQTVSGRDVGMEIVDTEARVKNLRAEETSLQALMGRSGKIPDILEVEHELSRVRGEIEQNQGRLNYLRQQVAYSTVTISLTEQTISTPTQGKPGLLTVFTNAIQSALGSLYDLCIQLIELLVWLTLGFLPRVILFSIGCWLGWKVIGIIYRRFWKKSKSGENK